METDEIGDKLQEILTTPVKAITTVVADVTATLLTLPFRLFK